MYLILIGMNVEWQDSTKCSKEESTKELKAREATSDRKEEEESMCKVLEEDAEMPGLLGDSGSDSDCGEGGGVLDESGGTIISELRDGEEQICSVNLTESMMARTRGSLPREVTVRRFIDDILLIINSRKDPVKQG